MEVVVTEEIIARPPPEAQAILRLLLAQIAELEAEGAKLKARIKEFETANAKLRTGMEELERQGKRRTPQNWSLPPSTQHPHARPQPPKRKSKKKRGGQPGHEKHERPLIPAENCNRVEACKPGECRRCGAKPSGSDPEPLRPPGSSSSYAKRCWSASRMRSEAWMSGMRRCAERQQRHTVYRPGKRS